MQTTEYFDFTQWNQPVNSSQGNYHGVAFLIRMKKILRLSRMPDFLTSEYRLPMGLLKSSVDFDCQVPRAMANNATGDDSSFWEPKHRTTLKYERAGKLYGSFTKGIKRSWQWNNRHVQQSHGKQRHQCHLWILLPFKKRFDCTLAGASMIAELLST